MISYYQSRIAQQEDVLQWLKKRNNWFYLFRLFSFSLFLLFVIFSVSTSNLLWIVLSMVGLIAFIHVLRVHLNLLARIKRETYLLEILNNEIACLELQGNIYCDGNAFCAADHDYASDMDVYGAGSIFEYINRCATAFGIQRLAEWLGKPATKNVVSMRQQAVDELSGNVPLMEEISLKLFENKLDDFDKSKLFSLKGTEQSPKHLKILTIIVYVLLGLSVAGILFLGLNAWILSFTVVFNLFLRIKYGAFVLKIKSQLPARKKILDAYRGALEVLEGQAWQSPLWKEIHLQLQKEGQFASQKIAKLNALSDKADYSLNFIMGVLLNLLLAWDVFYAMRMSRWFDQNSEEAQQWFSSIGEAEALLSFAKLKYNQPQWVFPTFSEQEFLFDAKELGHPLIPEGERVCNDFVYKTQKQIHIVTGSNMAGKSTFLRTIGVNIVLAQAGSVVCAKYLKMSPFRIMTYLTITDSLKESTSTFYREIKRLKKILDSAREDTNVLLLLDELLRGTNSADKSRGSIAIAKELMAYGIPAIIATHNLELARLQEEFADGVENHYFDISIEGEKMLFDYRLKPGICNTFNASVLLRSIGIDLKD